MEALPNSLHKIDVLKTNHGEYTDRYVGCSDTLGVHAAYRQ